MIARLLLSCAVLIVVGLVLVYLLGPILMATAIPFVVIVGHFLTQWGWVLALAAAIWFYFAGYARVHL